MPTIPTGRMELELRKLYIRWVENLPKTSGPSHESLKWFQDKSTELIEKMGGEVARLGTLPGFPAPKLLDLSPHIGTVYNEMEQVAIQAAIATGLNPNTATRAMMRAGMDKSYRRLNRLARTETVSAYWKNAWDSVAEFPELVMVWGAEDGPRTCAWCRERDGMVMTSADLRDHPNGRCTPLPTLRSRVEYRGSVGPNGLIYQDPEWTKKSVSGFDGEYNAISEEEALSISKGFDELEFDQQLAVMHYQRSGYKQVNGVLRNGSAEELAAQAEVIGHLDSVMKPLDRDVVLRRGQGWRSMLSDLGIKSEVPFPEEWDVKSKIGMQLTQPGYYSASIDSKVANSFLKDSGFLIDVEVPRGTSAHFVKTGTKHDEELELLLERGLDFVLTKADLVTDPRGTGEQVWRITLRAVL